MALDTGSIPDVDSSAGMAGGDAGDGSGGESQDPTLADMDAIMSAEAAVEDAAGFELGETIVIGGGAQRKPPEEKKAEVETKPPAETPAAKPDEAVVEEPAVAADAAATAKAAEEATRLRKGFAKLAQDRQNVVAKMNEANAAIERAKTYEAAHAALQSLPGKVQADPLAFLAEHGVDVDTLLDKVIATEKSPIEREMAALRKELADKEAAQTKAQAEREAREKAAFDAKVIADWRDRNVAVAAKDPEKYDLIVSLGQEDAVHETCLAYHSLHGVILDPVIAANEVEKTLRAGAAKSKYIKTLGQSAPAAPAAKPAAANAQRSNSTPAPKQTGPRTLAGVSSGDSAPSAAEYPEDEDARFEVALREMRAEGVIA